LSDWFQIQRGCRQGILCAEILALLMKNNTNIKGIRLNTCNSDFLLSQYADDTTIMLD
jgi:hypothetical protein